MQTRAIAARPPLTRRAGDFLLAVKSFPPQAALPRRRDEGASICVVVAGGVTERDETARHRVRSGDALFRPCGQPHSASVDCSGARVVVVATTGRALEAIQRAGLPLDRPRQTRSTTAAAVASRIQHELREDDPGSQLILEGLALELFGATLRSAQGRPRPPAWLAEVKAALGHELQRPHSLGELAARAGVSPAHLAWSFRNRYGTSVGGFLRRARVEEAALRLAETDTPLARIALECGFCDQSHLSRTFKRLLGLSPGAWRRGARDRGARS